MYCQFSSHRVGQRAIPVSAFRGNRIQTSFAPSLRTRHQRSQGVRVFALFGLGVPELAVIGVVAALVFGPSKLPELGKLAGKSVKSFQSAAKEFSQELKDEVEKDATQIAEAGTKAATEVKDKATEVKDQVKEQVKDDKKQG